MVVRSRLTSIAPIWSNITPEVTISSMLRRDRYLNVVNMAQRRLKRDWNRVKILPNIALESEVTEILAPSMRCRRLPSRSDVNTLHITRLDSPPRGSLSCTPRRDHETCRSFHTSWTSTECCSCQIDAKQVCQRHVQAEDKTRPRDLWGTGVGA